MKGKRTRRILLALACVLLCLGVSLHFVNSARHDRMLQAVGLDGVPGLRQVDYARWHDPLQYTDGYEIMAFAIDEALWQAPAGWTEEAGGIDVSGLAGRLAAQVNTDAILNLSLGGMNCHAWFFADHRDGRPFDEQEFYLAWCDATYPDSMVVFIYRGHHLYGL